MASFSESPNPWADTYKDCSQGICSIYCPQWCYIIFPPPPPFFDYASDDGNEKSSGSDFSPLIIAVIGILGSAFILLTYYTIISKFCRRVSTGTVAGEGETDGGDGAGQPASTFREGLEEGLIRSIRVYKYRSGDGFVDGADCAVCLSEFEENERLRLLPKCNHAFHVPCIDMWLKSHSSCPLCRADIAPFVVDHDEDVKNEVVVVVETSSVTSNAYRTSDEVVVSHVVVVEDDAGPKIGPADPMVRRSSSLNIRDRFCSDRVLVADILRDEEEGEDRENGTQMCFGIGTSSKGGFDDHDDDDDHCKYERSGALAMRRSISASRFVCSRHGKANNSLLPI